MASKTMVYENSGDDTSMVITFPPNGKKVESILLKLP
jgi:hypothetical protein